jgi:predicted N-acyltransferase
MTTKASSMTNAHYAQTPGFRKACQQYLETSQQYLETSQVNLELEKITTRRQASKFRRGTGVVYKTINGLMQ